MPRALPIPPLDEAAGAEPRRRYDPAPDPETRRRYQLGWLAHLGQRVPRIALAVPRRAGTVTRVLHRSLDGGLDAVPRRTPPGAAPTITPAWDAEPPRVIDLAPHVVGVAGAAWATGLRAASPARQTGIAVSDERVRQALRARGHVRKRPTWTPGGVPPNRAGTRATPEGGGAAGRGARPHAAPPVRPGRARVGAGTAGR